MGHVSSPMPHHMPPPFTLQTPRGNGWVNLMGNTSLRSQYCCDAYNPPPGRLCSFLPHVKQTFHIEHIAKWALSFANSIVQLHLKSCLFGVGTTAILMNKIKIFLPARLYVLNILLLISLNTKRATKDFSQHYISCYYPNTNVRIKCSFSAINTITSPFWGHFSPNLCAKINMAGLWDLINI